MGIFGEIQRRMSMILGRELYNLKGESKQKHMRMQMAVLNLNNSSSTTEEHHQTGYLLLPSEWKNKCYKSSEEGEIFVLSDGQKEIIGFGVGEKYLTQTWKEWVRFLQHEGSREGTIAKVSRGAFICKNCVYPGIRQGGQAEQPCTGGQLGGRGK